VLVGCAASALLALALDQTIRLLEAGARRRSRRLLVAAGAVLLVLYGYTAASFAAGRLAARESVVRIGAKTFTEQYILAELLALQVRRETGLGAELVASLGSTVAFDALRAGDLDAYVDYSGTIWATILKRGGSFATREGVLAEVAAFLADRHGIRLVAALGFENAYALGMRAEHAAALGVSRVGDLAPLAPALEIGGDYEFFHRPEWAALVEGYGLRFRRERSMDSALMYQAVAEGQVDVISAFTSDGRIAAYGITLLEDERGVIPPYDAIVLAGPALAARAPAAVEALGRLAGSIDAPTMRRLNLAVDRDGRSPADVAREFLDGR
jgi:osmoprotectant transport system permease protein